MKASYRLAIALLLPLSGCTHFIDLPHAYRGYYLWHPLLSNADGHPKTTIYTADTIFREPIIEVNFPSHPQTLPRRFLVDTSQPISLISADLAQSLGLRIRITKGLPGHEEDAAGFARVDLMQTGEIRLRQVPVAVVRQMTAVGDDDLPVSIDGVLGMNILSQMGVELSTRRGQMTLFPSGRTLQGETTRLADTPHQLIISGEVGAPPKGQNDGPSTEPGYGGEELSWAPILVQSTTADVPVPEGVDALYGGRITYPQAGRHLILVGTGQRSTQIHPEVMPWAGSDGTFATIPHTQKSTLLDRLLGQLLDEEPRAKVLEEVTRYHLDILALGPTALEDLSIHHGEGDWLYGPMSVMVASDLLSDYTLQFDYKRRRLSLSQDGGDYAAPSIQAQLLAWAENTLSPDQNNYTVLEEALSRFIAVGRWPEAAQLASRMVQQNPGDLAAWLVLARQSERREDYKTGIDLYRRMYWLEGGNLVGRMGSSRLYFLEGDLDAALKELQGVTTRNELERARVWRLKGQIYLAAGNPSQAKAAMEQALRAGQEDAGALRVLTYLAWQRADYAQAEHYLHRLLKLTPDDAWAQNTMLSVLRRQNREGDIDTWVEALARRFPYPPPDGRDPLAPLRIRLARERGQDLEMKSQLFNQLRAYGKLAQTTSAPSVKAKALETQARIYLAARSHLSEALNLAGQANSTDPTGTAGLIVGAQILDLMGDPSARSAHIRAWENAPLDFSAWLAAQGASIPQLAPPPPPKVKKKTKKRRKSRRRLPKRLPNR